MLEKGARKTKERVSYLEITIRGDAESVARTTKVIRHAVRHDRRIQKGEEILGSAPNSESATRGRGGTGSYLVMNPMVP